MKEAIFSSVYDVEEDVLYLHSDRSNSKESIEISKDIVLDVDKDNNLVGIEIFDASLFLNEVNSEINSDVLSKLNNVKVNVKLYREFLIIGIVFKIKNKEVSEKLTVQTGEYESPLVASVA